VTDQRSLPPAQLLAYGFGPGADFEGRLLGALERIESGGALRILEALFVTSDAETGELVAIDLKGDGAGGIVAPMLSFRLEPAARRRATERALNPAGGGLPSESLRELGRALEPGASVVAVLVEHRWTRAVEDAVTRTGGTLVANEHVDSTGLAQHIPELLAAARTASSPEAD
jgi:hypothetical protein